MAGKKNQKKLIWLLVSTFLLLILGFVYFKYFNNFSIKTITTKNKISTVILPDTNVLENEQKNLLKNVSHNFNPTAIILLSPNHLEKNQYSIFTTDQNVKLDNNLINIDKTKIKKLSESVNVSINNSFFVEQFKDSSLLSNINQNFPDAKLLPLVIKSDLSEKDARSLSNDLIKFCSSNCLLISQINFSETQLPELAKIHNTYNRQILEGLNSDAIYNSDISSKPNVLVALLFAKNQQTEKFNYVTNANTEGYIIGDFASGEKVVSDNIAFMIGGDVMFDRAVDGFFRGDKLVDVVKNLSDNFFKSTNVSIVNLEGPISEEEIEINLDPENLSFNFPPKTPEVLNWLGVNAVSLANNHTGNAGGSGLENTRKVLDEKKITWIGGPSFKENPVREFGNRKKLSVIALNALSQAPNIENQIRSEKGKGNTVLVFPHWGNEYQTNHSSLQEKLAHAWIDAGADLIIGSHPHVIQDMEIYNNKPIVYSLGNLVFDQNFSNATEEGLVIGGMIDSSKIKLVFIPIKINRYQPEIMTEKDKERIIDKLKKSAGLAAENHDSGYDSIEVK